MNLLRSGHEQLSHRQSLVSRHRAPVNDSRILQVVRNRHEELAKQEGAKRVRQQRRQNKGDFRVYWTIMMPQAKAVIGSVAIFAFLHSWNNFLEPLVYLSRMEKFTVPIGLSFFQGQFNTEYTTLMAGATAAVVPILFVYFFAQDYFVKGIITTGLKG
jgi:hypothetical protein